MKTPTKGMLQLDAIIQGILIIPILIAYISALIFLSNGTIFIALALQFILGIYQLGSGFIRTIRHGSAFRRNYLVVAIGYILVLIAGTTIVSSTVISDSFLYFLGVMGMMVIPVVMALFYWYRTIQQFRGKFEESVGFQKQENLTNLAAADADDRLIEEIILRQKERIKK